MKLNEVTKELMFELLENASRFSDVVRLFYDYNGGGAYRQVSAKIKELGLTKPDYRGNGNISNFNNRRLLDDILVEDSTYKNNVALKRRLIKEGILIEICTECGQLPKWNGKRLALQLEHRNGISNDNRIENLELLCPNCHTQTETYAGRNIKGAKKKRSRVEYLHDLKTAGIQKQETKINNVLMSNIDFSVYGWVSKVAHILELKPQKVNIWMKKYLTDFYETECFKRQV